MHTEIEPDILLELMLIGFSRRRRNIAEYHVLACSAAALAHSNVRP